MVEKSAFTFERNTGKAIANRLKHLSDTALFTLAEWGREKIKEYAIRLVEPRNSGNKKSKSWWISFINWIKKKSFYHQSTNVKPPLRLAHLMLQLAGKNYKQ